MRPCASLRMLPKTCPPPPSCAPQLTSALLHLLPRPLPPVHHPGPSGEGRNQPNLETTLQIPVTLDKLIRLSEPQFPTVPPSRNDRGLTNPGGSLKAKDRSRNSARPPSPSDRSQAPGTSLDTGGWGREGVGSFSLQLLPRSPRDASPRSPSPHLAVAVLGQVFHQDFSAVAQLPAHPLQPRGDLLRVQRGGRRAPGVVARLGGGVRPARPRLRLGPRRAAQARAPLAAGSRCRRRHLPGRPRLRAPRRLEGKGEREPEEARAGARRAEAAEWVGGGGGRRRRSQQPAGGKRKPERRGGAQNHLAGPSPSGPRAPRTGAPAPPAGTSAPPPEHLCRRGRAGELPSLQGPSESPGLGSGDAALWHRLSRGHSGPRRRSPRGLPT